MLDVDYRLKKLHLAIPEKLWIYLKENKMFFSLDELISGLLVEYINKVESGEIDPNDY